MSKKYDRFTVTPTAQHIQRAEQRKAEQRARRAAALRCIDGDAMRWTDSPITAVPEAATVAETRRELERAILELRETITALDIHTIRAMVAALDARAER